METINFKKDKTSTWLKGGLVIFISLLSLKSSFGMNDTLLRNEIINKINIDLRDIELDQFHQDFVAVSFNIIEGKIQITEVNSSNPELQNLIELNLSLIVINSSYNESETYLFRFNFISK